MNKSKESLLIAFDKGYRCDKNGNVSGKNNSKISPYMDNNGYRRFSVRIPKCEDVKSHSRSVPLHRLQAYQKYGDKIFEEGVHVRHLNSNPEDNSWDNISIGSAKDNMMDKPKHIRVKWATNASNSVRRFSDDEMVEIKKFYEKVKSYKMVMDKYNISSKGTLHHMLNKDYVTTK